jgi:long-chain acyl-CoA synthetase
VSHDTFSGYLDQWANERPDDVWLRDRKGDDFSEWSWGKARAEISAMAASLEKRFGNGVAMAILSRNRAHWFLADFAIIESGNISIPVFTTLPGPTAKYVFDFSETKVLFLGETENWDVVRTVLPQGTMIITLPGVEIDEPHTTWDDFISDARGSTPNYQCEPDDLVSLVFTSGTTGVPKGVIQTHNTNIAPMRRFDTAFSISETPRFLSYLPLSHIAERQLVEGHSLIRCGTVTFNEGLPHILRDLQYTRPHFFFGPPRVWEQLQQMVIGQFGSQQEVDKALSEDKAGTGKRVLDMLGLDEVDYCLTAAAPTPPALIKWFDDFGLMVLEGFGQTEAMGLIANTKSVRRIGAIGKPVDGVEITLSEDDELLVKAEGLSPGYYKMPDKTAELLRDGWLHTGDKARIDDDGFIYITGRVKDYFKTIHGKFVAPTPIENVYADNEHTEQICLLGRGYSKTVVVCVLSQIAQAKDRGTIEAALREQAAATNKGVDKHARIGGVIVSTEPWTIANAVLTPTMKIRREQVEGRFGEQAERIARSAAEKGEILVEWAQEG